MSQLSYEAKLFWIYHETQACSLNKANGAGGKVQLSFIDEQNESHAFSGTLAHVIDAGFMEIAPDAEAEVADEKVRALFSRLTFGLVENPLQHTAEEALYEQASS